MCSENKTVLMEITSGYRHKYKVCLLASIVIGMPPSFPFLVLPGVKAEAAPHFTASAGLMIAGLLSSFTGL